MRELKFRSWANPGFVYLDLIDDNDFGFYAFYSCCDSNDIEQYTGLKDKNGKEIYEGDVVKLTILKSATLWNGLPDPLTPPKEVDEYYQVTNSGWEFHARLVNKHIKKELIPSEVIQSEIVGNIHENPELLEGEE